MSINLEEDKVDSLANTNDMKELSEQVIKLSTMEDKFAAKEEELKKIKNDMDVLSGEVIPTMMTEMNISKFCDIVVAQSNSFVQRLTNGTLILKRFAWEVLRQVQSLVNG